MQNKKVIRNALIVGIIAILLGATFFPAVSKHVIHADFRESGAISEISIMSKLIR